MQRLPILVEKSPAVLLGAALLAGCAAMVQETGEGRSASPAALPTIEVAHQRIGPPLPSAGASAITRVSYRLCVDTEKRRAVDVRLVLGTAPTDAALSKALLDAEWQVSRSGDDRVVCFLENLESDASGAWRTTPQPYLTVAAERLSQANETAPQIPAAAQQGLIGKNVVGLYRMCLAQGASTASAVTPVIGIPGADQEISAALRTWQYKAPAAETCWVEPLSFAMVQGPVQEQNVNENLSKRPRGGLGDTIR